MAKERQLRLANSVTAHKSLVDGDYVFFVNGRVVLDQLSCDIAVGRQNEQPTAICVEESR